MRQLKHSSDGTVLENKNLDITKDKQYSVATRETMGAKLTIHKGTITHGTQQDFISIRCGLNLREVENRRLRSIRELFTGKPRHSISACGRSGIEFHLGKNKYTLQYRDLKRGVTAVPKPGWAPRLQAFHLASVVGSAII